MAVQAGGTSESVELAPETDTVIEATGPDGGTYRLVIPAFSLATPATITLRPLSAADMAGATFVAGVEIEPSGTDLLYPATLTITPAGTPDATNLVDLEYSGSGPAAAAQLAALSPGASASEHSFLLTHFSGGVVGSLDSQGEQLWLENKTFNTSTVAGRKAQAEHNIRVIEWSEKTGRMSETDAKSSIKFWNEQWWEAEADGIAADPQLQEVITSGDLSRFDVVAKAVAEMLKAARELAQFGDPSIADAKMAEIDIGAYARHAVDHLRTDPAFQSKLTSGLVSDFAEIEEIIAQLIGLARGGGLAGTEDTDTYIEHAVDEFVHAYVNAIADSCRHALIRSDLLLGLVRLAAITNDQALLDRLVKCEARHFLITAHYEAPLVDMSTHTVTGVAQVEDWTLEGDLSTGFVLDGERGEEWPFDGLATHDVKFLYPPGADVFNDDCSAFGAQKWTGADIARIATRSEFYVEISLSPASGRFPSSSCQIGESLQPYGFTLLIHFDEHGIGSVDVRADSTVSDQYITATVETR
jgi:hypothetical protein